MKYTFPTVQIHENYSDKQLLALRHTLKTLHWKIQFIPEFEIIPIATISSQSVYEVNIRIDNHRLEFASKSLIVELFSRKKNQQIYILFDNAFEDQLRMMSQDKTRVLIQDLELVLSEFPYKNLYQSPAKKWVIPGIFDPVCPEWEFFLLPHYPGIKRIGFYRDGIGRSRFLYSGK